MIIPVTPQPAVRMSSSDRWAKRPVVLRYFAYKDTLRLHWGSQELPERLRLVFVLPMPKSWSEKRREAMDGQPHQQRPDTDNLTKAVKDSLAIDDSYVWDEHSTKYWGRTGSVMIESMV